jgi:hypothetical protein
MKYTFGKQQSECFVDFVIELNFIEVTIYYIESMIGVSSPTTSKLPKRRSKE